MRFSDRSFPERVDIRSYPRQLTVAATRNIVEQADYYRAKSGDTLANRWRIAVRDTVASLRTMRHRGDPCPFVNASLARIRRLEVAGFERFSPFYRVNDATNVTLVLLIVHEARDVEALLPPNNLTTLTPMTLHPTDALLLIDLQPDFMPGGALPVTGGDEILPLIHTLAARFDHVLLTQDWHPPQHISFATSHPGAQPYQQVEAPYGTQTLWPEHCLQHSPGAALHSALDIPHAELILRKGFRRHIDSYSAFLENDHATPTGLAGYLRERGLERLYIAGLAYDFCVRFSAIDGKSLGFETLVLEDACRAVNLPGSVAETNAALASAGIPRIQSSSL